jgi:NAD(P)-dependent dehydrogenase (short-subunit alcohol dehydrogenase family)
VATEGVLDAFDVSERVVIVTGGSRGIGRAVASGLASLGAHVVVASRKADACERAVEEIVAAGGSALAVPTHMGDVDAIDALVAATVDRFGGIDVVVNNAANPLALPVGQITTEAFDKSFQTNLRGPVFLVQAALPHLRASEHASIINVVTAGIFTHATYVSLYVAMKSALMSMTRSMAGELAGEGIRVNAIAPGSVRTDMLTSMPEEFQRAAVGTQLIRRMAEPSEMVPPVLFLASGASSFMTGQVLVVDGGMTAH